MEKPPSLPLFPPIKIEEIPPASGIAYFAHNKIIEFYGNRRHDLWGGKSITKFPFCPPPFHFARYIDNGQTLQVGHYKTIVPIQGTQKDPAFRSERRIDIIIYKTIPDNIREAMVQDAMDDADKPSLFKWFTYGFADYLRFEPTIRWLIPSTRKDICSEDFVKWVARHWKAIFKKAANYISPWDVYLGAMGDPDCEIRTLWVGSDYMKRFFPNTP